MSVIIRKEISKNKRKTWYTLEWGKGAGQRIGTGIFTYNTPKDIIEKNHNKESLQIIKMKQSQMILNSQAIATGYIPTHKLKGNFIDYYAEFVNANSRPDSRHPESSLIQFKKFIGKDYLPPIDVTENLCERFRSYLLQKYNGETPANYFNKFKAVLKSATRDGYFIRNPAEMLQSKTKPNKRKKQVLEAEEYLKLLKVPCLNHEVKRAFIFCLYSGLRWCDVKTLTWNCIKNDSIIITQNKTKVLVEIPFHPISKMIAGERQSGLVFHLPTANGANEILEEWSKSAGLEKHITWHCARLSFSVLLQDEGVDAATVAGMLGHTTTRYVETNYQRYRVHVGRKAIQKLPAIEI